MLVLPSPRPDSRKLTRTAAEMEAAAEDDNAEDNVAEADTSTEEEE